MSPVPARERPGREVLRGMRHASGSGRARTAVGQLSPAAPSSAPSVRTRPGYPTRRPRPRSASVPRSPTRRSTSPRRIINSKAALEGERKQVTVLFADLKGSMELLADRDPEEARKILDPVLEHMMEAVHRYEGTVNQVMGDGIMALFGAPLAHEDHAVRACYAALRMQESVAQYAEGVFRTHGVPVQIRVGLNSGEVVVRAIGSDLHMDYTAVGQTTHLAARMEQMATPGTILLDGGHAALAEGYVRSDGPGAGRGQGPGGAHRGLRAHRRERAAHAAPGGRRAGTHAVRRARRGDAAAPSFAGARARGGHGQLVALVGEPGVGKSRLVYEFTHSQRAADWLILEAGCVSYGKATSLSARHRPSQGVLPGARPRRRTMTFGEKVTGKLLTLDRALEPILPAVARALGCTCRRSRLAGARPRPAAAAHFRCREAPAAAREPDQPLLLVLEDLHWIDTRDAGPSRQPGGECAVGAATRARELSPGVRAPLGRQDLLHPDPP